MAEPHSAVSRRRLLTLLGAGGATVAATQLSGQTAHAVGNVLDAPALRPEDYGAIGDGSTDDTAALNAALQAARPDASTRGPALVQLSGRTYAHSGEIVVPDGVQLNGVGYFSSAAGLAGSVLKATGSSAAVHVRGSGSGLSNLMVDANVTASVGVHTGGMATGDDGSDHWYANVNITSAVLQNWLIERTQNSVVLNCRSNVAYGEGLVIDRGAGGFVFTRCEFNSAYIGPNLRIGANGAGAGGYPSPTNLMFVNCQAEWRTSDGPEVQIQGGQSLRFHGLSVYHPAAGHTSPLIDVTGGARATFVDILVGGNADRARPAIKVGPGYSSTYPAVVSLAGESRCFGVSSLLDVKSLGNVLMSGPVTGLQSDAGTGIGFTSAATDPLTVRDDRQWLTEHRHATALGSGSVVERGFVQGEAQPRFVRDISGTVQLGAGGSAAPDVSYQRQDLGGGAAALGATPGVYAPRFVHPALADLVPSSAGVVTVDAAASDRHTVMLSADCTALIVNNLVAGQYLTVLFKQATPAKLLAIGSVTGSGITGVQWQCDAAPTVGAAGRAVACTFVLSGTVLYEVSRAGSAASEGWTAPSLGSNVVNYGNGYNDIGYQRSGARIYLRGAFAASGTLAAKGTLFTLPAGYRPARTWIFSSYGTGIQVLSSGKVQNLVQMKSGVMGALDGIVFSLD